MNMDEMITMDTQRGRLPSLDDKGLEAYFATYVPLSNLPTPPLSSQSSPLTVLEVGSQVARSEFSLPSYHLSQLVPQSASRYKPCPELISSYLRRARLPESTVALAACILESLSCGFVRSWRRECSNILPPPYFPSSSPTNIASSKSEVIVLAALAVSNSFLDDRRGEPRWWATYVANGSVGIREVDATIRSIAKDLDYDLCGFTVEEVTGMKAAMFGESGASTPGAE